MSEGGKAARLALPADIEAGETAMPGGKPLPLALTQEASARFLYRAAPQMYFDDKLHAYLRAAIYDNEELQESYRRPLLLGLLSLFAQLPFAIRKDILEDRHAFLKLGNHVARFDFDYLDLPKRTPAFVARKLANDELSFDPKKLRPAAPIVNLESGVSQEADGAAAASDVPSGYQFTIR